jgi:hypothetical protein
MEILANFIFWFAGVDTNIMMKLKITEKNKYGSLGASVLLTGIMASLSFGYVMSWAFPDSNWVPIISGLIWGAVILNLDRYIVSQSIKQDKKLKKENIGSLLSRISLALAISFIVSVPIELKLFEADLAKIYIQENLKELRIELEDYRNTKKVKEEEYQKQLKGDGNRKSGPGVISNRLKIDIDELDIKITKTIEKIDIIANKKLSEIRQNPASFGLLDRYNTLAKLKTTDSGANTLANGVRLLFVLIEIIPVILKLITPRSDYEDYLEGVKVFED